MKRYHAYGPSLIVLATLAVALFAGPFLMHELVFAQQEARVQFARQQLADSPQLAQLNDAFQGVARVVEPSVVNVEVRGRRPQMGQRGPMQAPPGMPEEFFRRFFGDRGPMQEQQPQEESPYGGYDVPQPFGNGSGWVYDDQGHIITNYHVIANADEIVIKFFDQREVRAEVVGTDPQTDIAVLKVPVDNLVPAVRAEEAIEQGEIVFAFGSPFRYEFSMSQGIVMGKGRRIGILGRTGYEYFIQTDASINPGNSGGPLTNIYGQVVGMNSAIATTTGAFAGIGFAIPVDMVTYVADQLIGTGQVSRGYLGVWIGDDPDLLRSFGYEGAGVLVEDVIPGSPAAEAGLQRGDIITQIEGREMASASDLRRTVARYAPGEEIEVNVWREGETRQVTVTLGKQPAEIAGGQPQPRGPQEQVEPSQMEALRQLGIEEVTNFTRELAQGMGMQFTEGVLVQEVRPNSTAAAAGIQPGVVIVEVMNEPVTSVSDLARALEERNLEDGVRLTVLAGEYRRYVFLRLPG